MYCGIVPADAIIAANRFTARKARHEVGHISRRFSGECPIPFALILSDHIIFPGPSMFSDMISVPGFLLCFPHIEGLTGVRMEGIEDMLITFRRLAALAVEDTVGRKKMVTMFGNPTEFFRSKFKSSSFLDPTGSTENVQLWV